MGFHRLNYFNARLSKEVDADFSVVLYYTIDLRMMNIISVVLIYFDI